VHESLEVAGCDCSVTDLAESAGVSERTLRIVFAENFGLSPKRLLILRQLHAVRRDLQGAVPGETVTQIAQRNGVWELGRFAHQYESLFGEYPSTTLM
jgi:AraC family ethanolamine operon transcriptional activator